jgi:hypothetical protein
MMKLYLAKIKFEGYPVETPQYMYIRVATHMYSDDGINWISLGVAFPFSGPIWAEELSIFVASSYNNKYGANNYIGWVSSDGIDWSELEFQPGAWSPELGLFLCPGGYSPVTKTF